MQRIAIIGAGLAGLTLAHRLSSHFSVMLYEKSRGVSGRMSTRYADPYQFDHGAQYFTIRDDDFRHFLQPLLDQAVVVPWEPRLVSLSGDHDTVTSATPSEPWYVGAPKMNSLARALVKPHTICLQTEIRSLSRDNGQWTLHDTNDAIYSGYDIVISTAPYPQAVKLLASHVQTPLQDVVMKGSFSLMIGTNTPPDIPWDAARVENSPIKWMAVNSSKPERDTGFSLIAQTAPDWSEEHMERDAEALKLLLLDEVQRLLQQDIAEIEYLTLHRWRYANTEQAFGQFYLHEADEGLAACGDWCIGGRVEAAFLSANALAEQLLA